MKQYLFILKHAKCYKLFLMAVMLLSLSNFLSAQVTDPLYIDTAGKVGIGTTTPNAKLTVGPNLIGTLSPVFVTNAGALGTTSGSRLDLASIGFTSTNTTSLGIKAVRTANGTDWNTSAIGLSFDVDVTSPVNNSQIWMHASGNVGIGNSNPGYKLDVTGNIHSTAGLSALTLKGDAPSFLYSGGPADNTNNVVLRKDNNFAYIYPWGTGTTNNTVVVGGAINTALSVSGYVGIGTNDPKVPLDIKDAGTHIKLADKLYWIRGADGYRDGTVAGHDNRTNNYGGTVSVRATGIIVADNFFTVSDARMKTEMVRSDAGKDLKLLNQLTVTDYYYKDMASHGGQNSKGFVAQQVEQLLPQAVEKHTDFIPDIFMMADEVIASNGVLTILMSKQHQLTDGDMVRLITEKEGTREVLVNVINDRVFTVSNCDLKTNTIFVYGKKVNDFKTVNYQQIFSLGISAIQELSRQVDELKLENKKLRLDMQSKLELLEKKIEKLATPEVTSLQK
ncbi:MAG TPA: tail fiber domain-containing protein [Chitinophagaceae bacterium]|nr:tail fiber domain-containing protein [Chitinophagaceae bacterium]